jgi:hypothetical protein
MLAREGNAFKALSMMGEIKSEFQSALKLNPNHIGARWAHRNLPAVAYDGRRK